MLVSGIQQSDSVIYMCKNVYSFFIIFLSSLIYMLVSGIQQSDSVIYMCKNVYSFFIIFLSSLIYYRILNIIPCAIQ